MQALRARNDRLAQKVASQKVVIAAQKNVIKKQDRVLNGIAEKASTATGRAITPRMTAAAAEEHRRVEEAARLERRQECGAEDAGCPAEGAPYGGAGDIGCP
mgnify:CR=1 FL=1